MILVCSFILWKLSNSDNCKEFKPKYYILYDKNKYMDMKSIDLDFLTYFHMIKSCDE